MESKCAISSRLWQAARKRIWRGGTFVVARHQKKTSTMRGSAGGTLLAHPSYGTSVCQTFAWRLKRIHHRSPTLRLEHKANASSGAEHCDCFKGLNTFPSFPFSNSLKTGRILQELVISVRTSGRFSQSSTCTQSTQDHKSEQK